MEYYATVGRSAFIVESWPHVSGAYRALCDHLGVGASQAPRCLILDDRNRVVAHVSYNGRVWRGEHYRPGDQPLYDPISSDRRAA